MAVQRLRRGQPAVPMDLYQHPEYAAYADSYSQADPAYNIPMTAGGSQDYPTRLARTQQAHQGYRQPPALRSCRNSYSTLNTAVELPEPPPSYYAEALPYDPRLYYNHTLPRSSIAPSFPTWTSASYNSVSVPVHSSPLTTSNNNDIEYIDHTSSRRRPRHPCPFSACPSTIGRKHDLKRHMASFHSSPTINCSVNACERVNDAGFSRLDHYRTHLKKVHGIDGTGRTGVEVNVRWEQQ